MEGVEKLIFTSSASVVFEGKDLIDVDEVTAGYSTKPMDYYAMTKVNICPYLAMLMVVVHLP